MIFETIIRDEPACYMPAVHFIVVHEEYKFAWLKFKIYTPLANEAFPSC